MFATFCSANRQTDATWDQRKTLLTDSPSIIRARIYLLGQGLRGKWFGPKNSPQDMMQLFASIKSNLGAFDDIWKT
jgi:hypothetical protein